MPLISSKVKMNQFQRTFFLIIRKISIFESALIHRRTHELPLTSAHKQCGFQKFRKSSGTLAGVLPADMVAPRTPALLVAASVGCYFIKNSVMG